jgi:hypothetical protein
MGMDTGETIVLIITLGALAVFAYLVYIVYTAYLNGLNIVNTLTNPNSYTVGPLANPTSQAGASATILYSLPSIYQGAPITYATTAAQTNAALTAQQQAFSTNPTSQPSVVVSNTGVMSTSGGGVTVPVSGQGTATNPFIFANGWQGIGSYSISNQSGGTNLVLLTSQAAYQSEQTAINTGVSGGPSTTPSGGMFNWFPKL